MMASGGEVPDQHPPRYATWMPQAQVEPRTGWQDNLGDAVAGSGGRRGFPQYQVHILELERKSAVMGAAVFMLRDKPGKD